MLFVRIPVERVGVLIGPKGQTRKRIQEVLGVGLEVDSTSGEVVVTTEGLPHPENALKARDIVTAIGRGFSEDRALRLLEEEVYLEVMNIKEFAGKNRDRVKELAGRLIGTKGKTRRIIEDLTGADLSVFGHTVSIVGDLFQIGVARRATEMILKGSEHATVYRFLERQRAYLKIAEMGF